METIESRVYNYLRRVVNKAARVWPEGTFRVLPMDGMIYVHKPHAGNTALPDEPDYQGQHLMKVDFVGSIRNIRVWYDGVEHLLTEEEFKEMAEHFLTADICQWFAP